jgi:hypothetical protein
LWQFSVRYALKPKSMKSSRKISALKILRWWWSSLNLLLIYGDDTVDVKIQRCSDNYSEITVTERTRQKCCNLRTFPSLFCFGMK